MLQKPMTSQLCNEVDQFRFVSWSWCAYRQTW